MTNSTTPFAFDLAVALLRKWRAVLGAIAVAVVLAVAISLLLPRRYSARALLAVPETQPDARSQLLSLAPVAAAVPGLSLGNPNTRLVSAALKSQSLRDSLRTRFGALKLIATQNPTDGSITVEVRQTDARRAADAANAVGPMLNDILTRLTRETAQRRQEFLEAQLADAEHALDRSQRMLVDFERGINAPDIDAQAKQTLETAQQLQQKITEQQIRVAMLLRTATNDNPELQNARAELAAWREQLRQLQSGTLSKVLLPLADASGLKAQTAQLLRNYARDEQVYGALTANLAQARIAAQNNLPVVSVIDTAVPPRKPSSPGPLVIAALAALLALLATVVQIGLSTHFARQREETYKPLSEAWAAFKADLR